MYVLHRCVSFQPVFAGVNSEPRSCVVMLWPHTFHGRLLWIDGKQHIAWALHFKNCASVHGWHRSKLISVIDPPGTNRILHVENSRNYEHMLVAIFISSISSQYSVLSLKRACTANLIPYSLKLLHGDRNKRLGPQFVLSISSNNHFTF